MAMEVEERLQLVEELLARIGLTVGQKGRPRLFWALCCVRARARVGLPRAAPTPGPTTTTIATGVVGGQPSPSCTDTPSRGSRRIADG